MIWPFPYKHLFSHSSCKSPFPKENHSGYANPIQQGTTPHAWSHTQLWRTKSRRTPRFPECSEIRTNKLACSTTEGCKHLSPFSNILPMNSKNNVLLPFSLAYLFLDDDDPTSLFLLMNSMTIMFNICPDVVYPYASTNFGPLLFSSIPPVLLFSIYTCS